MKSLPHRIKASMGPAEQARLVQRNFDAIEAALRGQRAPPDGTQVKLPAIPELATFSLVGDLMGITDDMGYTLYEDRTLVSALAHVGAPPTGADVIIHLRSNIQIGSALTIASGTMTSGWISQGVLLQAGDPITIDVVQVGSTSPGRDLTVQVRLL